MKKIAYITATVELGGAEISLCTLLRDLDRQQFDPVVALPGPGPLTDRIDALGVRYKLLPMEIRRRRHPFSFRRSQNAIRRWLLKESPSLIHINSFHAPELAIPPAKRAGFPTVYHCRDLYDYIDSDRASVFRSCDAIISITRCVADRLDDILPGLPQYIAYNDVNLETLDQTKTDLGLRDCLGWQDNKVIGIASRISPDKGQLDFVRAAGLIAEKHPDARFLIVGSPLFTHDKDYGEKLYKEIAALGIESKVHFTGFVDNMASCYRAMDICVLASQKEPFGLVVVEAMACGVPVVATRSGGPQEIIEDGVDGLLVPVEAPEEIAESCSRLLKDATLYSSISANARSTVTTRFSGQEAKRIGQIYMDVLSNMKVREH